MEPNFDFEIPEGKVISGISYGVGGHLHNITAYYGNQPEVFQFQSPENISSQYSLLSQSSNLCGKTHDDTKNFDDWGKISSENTNTRLTSITVYYKKGKFVYGFRQKWECNDKDIEGDKHRGDEYEGIFKDGDKTKITFKYGEYITRVYGRNGDVIDKLVLELNTGRIYEFGGEGGDPFDCEIPPGYAVGCLTGGHNGHLHYIQAWYGLMNPATQSQTTFFYYPMPARFPQEANHGPTHQDTVQFMDQIDINNPTFRLDTVKVFYSNDNVVGFHSIYEMDGQYIFGQRFLGSSIQEDPSQIREKMLCMEVDEFITHLSGKSGDILDSITLKTNKGREITAGGEGGEYFEMDIPYKHCVGIIGGGKNGHIHNLKVYLGPVPNVMTTMW